MINNKHIAYSISFDELYEGLLREVELGHVNRQVNGLLELFDYSMSCTMEKAWNVFTLSARGLIVCPSEKRIIACGMEKFFNYGETGLPDSVKALAYSVLEKMDGCLSEDTILETEDGEKTIKEICETKYNGKIKSFDIDDCSIIFDTIVGHSILENTEQWYELETENGEKIKLTGNHLVFLPDLMCYRRVDELDGSENILLKK